jgi:hypothetical protein
MKNSIKLKKFKMSLFYLKKIVKDEVQNFIKTFKQGFLNLFLFLYELNYFFCLIIN